MRRRRTKADRKDKDEIVRKRIVGPKLKVTLSEKMEFCFSSQKNTFLAKRMATHSSTLAWIIPWTEEPGRLQSTGSPKVRYDGATNSFPFFFFLTP